MAERKAQSPYQKYHKREYRYSPAYYAWRRTITGKAHRLEQDHARNEERKRHVDTLRK